MCREGELTIAEFFRYLADRSSHPFGATIEDFRRFDDEQGVYSAAQRLFDQIIETLKAGTGHEDVENAAKGSPISQSIATAYWTRHGVPSEWRDRGAREGPDFPFRQAFEELGIRQNAVPRRPWSARLPILGSTVGFRPVFAAAVALVLFGGLLGAIAIWRFLQVPVTELAVKIPWPVAPPVVRSPQPGPLDPGPPPIQLARNDLPHQVFTMYDASEASAGGQSSTSPVTSDNPDAPAKLHSIATTVRCEDMEDWDEPRILFELEKAGRPVWSLPARKAPMEVVFSVVLPENPNPAVLVLMDGSRRLGEITVHTVAGDASGQTPAFVWPRNAKPTDKMAVTVGRSPAGPANLNLRLPRALVDRILPVSDAPNRLAGLRLDGNRATDSGCSVQYFFSGAHAVPEGGKLAPYRVRDGRKDSQKGNSVVIPFGRPARRDVEYDPTTRNLPR